ncbi:uncharacterized protein N7496_011597 [Penicillium cataractarum]|uniref:Uncharacterized protein n=1 Tax=Penicillium cataractarum TaxID=2100454 RepID=A0A9W9UWG9_9EURO|nr:uncharacterized protein N7496_011597 [Penicillium cataractarum]KAJ5359184.1 hypothetical protein N7496_011597 [Penicillium cataractarum]
MDNRKEIYFTYKTVDAYEEFDGKVRQRTLVKSLGSLLDPFLPPIIPLYTRPLIPESIGEIKKLSEDIVVSDISN